MNKKETNIFKKSYLIYGFIFVIFILNAFLFFEIEELQEKISKLEEKSFSKVSDQKNIQIIKDLTDNKKSWEEYSNKKYNWSMRYPKNWYINDENAGKDIEKVSVSNKQFLTGGEIFWSNYENFSEFEKGSTPEDFKLLALVIYKDENRDMNKFAEHLGFVPSLYPYIIEIKSKNQEGKLYFLEEENEKQKGINSSKTAAIFHKDNLYYVFHIGLTEKENQNQQSINEIKDIISTFEINQ